MSKRTRLSLALLCGLVFLAALGLFRLLVRPLFAPPREEIGPIHALAFCPEGERFVTGNQDGTVRMWDATTGEELRSFGQQRPAVVAVAVSPDGRHVAGSWEELGLSH